MSLFKPKRVPSGVPTGGEFATDARAENADLVEHYLTTGEGVTNGQIESVQMEAYKIHENAAIMSADDVVSALNASAGNVPSAARRLAREGKAIMDLYHAKSTAMQAEDLLKQTNQLALTAAVNHLSLQGKANITRLEMTFNPASSWPQPSWRCYWEDGMYDEPPFEHEAVTLIDPKRPMDLIELCEGYDPERTTEIPLGMSLHPDGTLATMSIDLDKTMADRRA